MALRFFNTLSREVEPFVPISKGKVGMYSCGPTVYNYPHIGNYRAYVFADLLKRYLIWKGYDVKHVMNITDVDDKTIRDSRKEGKSLKEFTEKYAKVFMEELDKLRIMPATHYPLATEHINEMIDIINCLVRKGHAYSAKDGVYYKVDSFNDYGKLAHIDRSQLQTGASGRVTADEYTKENPQDFALWKAWSEDDGDVAWDAPIGKGRPGWHIECSAMSTRYLGESFDIHTGGVDLIFPHHQNEIAQSEGCTGHQFVKHWLHNEHLLVDGEKMSKSKGNFLLLGDALKKAPAEAVRYTLLATHYRQQLNFTFGALDASQGALERIQNLIVTLQQHKVGVSDGTVPETIGSFHKRFEEAMDDDLNIGEALGALFDYVKEVNTTLANGKIDEDDARTHLDALKDVDRVLSVMSFEESQMDSEIERLVLEREAARKGKDFKEADRIRDELKSRGIILEDTPQGVRWKRER